MKKRSVFVQSESGALVEANEYAVSWYDPEWDAIITKKGASTEWIPQLLRKIDEISRTKKFPVLADITTADGKTFSISIGLGDMRGSLLSTVGPDGSPPYQLSIGDSSKESASIWFSYMGSQSEFPGEALLPLDAAIDVLLDSLEKGEPSGRIEWEIT